MDPIVTAQYGLMAASRRFENSADRIAGQPADDSIDLATQVVNLVQAKQAFSANLTVIRFAEDMWNSLLRLQTAR